MYLSRTKFNLISTQMWSPKNKKRHAHFVYDPQKSGQAEKN